MYFLSRQYISMIDYIYTIGDFANLKHKILHFMNFMLKQEISMNDFIYTMGDFNNLKLDLFIPSSHLRLHQSAEKASVYEQNEKHIGSRVLKPQRMCQIYRYHFSRS